MSAEGLRKAVIERARAEAEEILARAKGEADAMLASARKKAESEAAAAVQAARRETADKRRRSLSALEREIRLKALEEKNRLLEEAFARAARAFISLPEKELGKLLAKEIKGLDLEGATVRVPKGGKKAFEAQLGDRAVVEEDESLEAGYILVRKDFRLDRSIGARLGELRSEMRSELARLLFEEEQ